MDRYLGGDGDIEQALLPPEELDPSMGRQEDFATLARVPMPVLAVEQRHEGFDEVCLGYDEDMARREASRCLRCDYRLHILAPVLPPERWLQLTSEAVSTVPELAGVYQLLDADKNILAIKGVMNMLEALTEELGGEQACFFTFEEDEMFTKRESELLQQYLQQHGELPGGGADELDDLF
jgi:formate dehydrogenase beta subunit